MALLRKVTIVTTAPTELVKTLDNGLKLILREVHEAPLASIWVWYRVGSRNELPGETGMSHWVEHMQFKGTRDLEKGAIFQSVSRVGGTLNAFTSQDWTTYFMTLPVGELDLALKIEADRMQNSLFDPQETESERTVILSERQGAENQPTYELHEEIMSAAFRAHPYGHSIIGFEDDLRSITRDDLYQHYRRAYRPNNAVIVAAGDFDAAELADRIEDAFGAIEPGDGVTRRVVREPEQRAERRVTLRKPAPTSYLDMAYKAPDSRHPDTAALLALDAILSGGKPMGLSSGGAMGRSSRLYRALVASGLARSASSDIGLTIDPHLFSISVTANPGVSLDEIESVVTNELNRLAEEPVGEEELQRALKQVKAQYIYSGEGVTNQAFWLGFMEMVDRYERARTLVDEIAAVTPADIQRVAATYFRPEKSTIGRLIPTGEPGGGSIVEAAATQLPYKPWALSGGSAENSRGFERAVMDNGLVVLSQARPTDPSIAMRFQVRRGAASDPSDQPGLAALTGRTLMRGTKELSFEEINQRTDDLGASISVETGRDSTDLVLRGLIEDTPVLLKLARDILDTPVFPGEEIDKVRQELITSIREQEDDTRSVASQAMRELLFPAGHPYRHRIAGYEATLNQMTRDDLLRFHGEGFGPQVTRVAVAGGFADLAAFLELLEPAFSSWERHVASPAPVASPGPPAEVLRSQERVAGKSQADVAIGTLGISRLDERYHAYETANLILGQLGLMGRLGTSVRDEQGLAYYAYSGVTAWETGSIWSAHAGVDPANAERTVEAVIKELERLTKEPVSDEELADAKSYLTGVLPLALERKSGVTATLLNIERFGLGLDYIDRYPEIIGALTQDALLTAAQQALDPNRLAIVVAGP